MHHLVVIIAVFTACGLPARAQESYFPELAFMPKNKVVNEIITLVTEVHLKAMNEPSVWKESQNEDKKTIYRLLWLASGQHPICVRLTRNGDVFVVHVAQHDGYPGYTAGRQMLSKNLQISSQQGERLLALLQKTSFWTSPVEVKENRGIADGDRIVIEGVKDRKYHVVSRAGLAASETYKEFCRSLLELAGVPNMLKAWDGFRERERKLRGYKPEPQQTEDLDGTQ